MTVKQAINVAKHLKERGYKQISNATKRRRSYVTFQGKNNRFVIIADKEDKHE